MLRWVALLLLLCLPAQASSKIHFFCTIASGETVDIWAQDGNVVVDFDSKGDWQKAFGKVDGNMVTITEIVAGGMFVLAWDTRTHEAYAITQHNKTGRKVENHAYCSWR